MVATERVRSPQCSTVLRASARVSLPPVTALTSPGSCWASRYIGLGTVEPSASNSVGIMAKAEVADPRRMVLKAVARTVAGSWICGPVWVRPDRERLAPLPATSLIEPTPTLTALAARDATAVSVGPTV